MQHERPIIVNQTELEIYRKDAILAAEELLYDDYIIEKIELAKTVSEIACIMTTARRSM